mmetsp:Transcript_61340/g.136622  ORF Transcript_61340/g.136622 Transcript_61340/m.136622 type:complete len:270 (-) Transcript_61340:606-1415(-)
MEDRTDVNLSSVSDRRSNSFICSELGTRKLGLTVLSSPHFFSELSLAGLARCDIAFTTFCFFSAFRPATVTSAVGSASVCCSMRHHATLNTIRPRTEMTSLKSSFSRVSSRSSGTLTLPRGSSALPLSRSHSCSTRSSARKSPRMPSKASVSLNSGLSVWICTPLFLVCLPMWATTYGSDCPVLSAASRSIPRISLSSSMPRSPPRTIGSARTGGLKPGGADCHWQLKVMVPLRDERNSVKSFELRVRRGARETWAAPSGSDVLPRSRS